MPTRCIFGLAGKQLTPQERVFFRQANPWGYILFGRNIEQRDQIRALVQDIRNNVGWFAPIFIDQEGGRVARLKPPLIPAYPPAQIFGQMPFPQAQEAANLGARLLAYHLRSFGITANCLPVLDLGLPDMHAVIGNRAYSAHPDWVAPLGAKAAQGTLEGGVLPVMKHLPGHGRSTQDSHLALPHVAASSDELAADFLPFVQNASLPAGMSAHIIYEAYDASWPATLSPTVIEEVIRRRIGFNGLLMTDDLSMKALDRFGSLAQRAQKALKAGCDIILHCTGILAEMYAIAEHMPSLQGLSAQRASACQICMPEEPPAFEFEGAYARFQELLQACTC